MQNSSGFKQFGIMCFPPCIFISNTHLSGTCYHMLYLENKSIANNCCRLSSTLITHSFPYSGVTVVSYRHRQQASSQSEMPLSIAIEDVRKAQYLFMNNKFEDARAVVRPKAHESMYHALWNGIFHYIEAFLTFEPQCIEEAGRVLEQTVQLCDQKRRKSSLFAKVTLKKANYDEWTADEIHAELCYSESLLLRAILTFIEDDNLMGFVKGGMKIRTCLASYKQCANILKERNWTDADDSHKAHFESGVRIGLGTYNFVLSLPPANVLKLLEFIGFAGDRDAGLEELKKGLALTGSLRQILCALTLLSFNLFTLFIISHGTGDLYLVQSIIEEQLSQFPDGAWYNFYKGRLSCLQGNVTGAVDLYKKACTSQNEWRQFHHICYWELMWAHVFQQKWKDAKDYADRLFQESRWSKVLSAYQTAAFKIMIRRSLTEDEDKQLIQVFKEIPLMKKRLGGRTLPIETFAMEKCARFEAQGNKLLIPGIELMYLWNGFKMIRNDNQSIRAFLEFLEETKQSVNEDYKGPYLVDNQCLMEIVIGVCHQCLGSNDKAEKSFDYVISKEREIKGDAHLVPYAIYEQALVYWSNGDLDRAQVSLETVKNKYKGYNLETQLQLRVQSAFLELQKKRAKTQEAKKTSQS